MNTRPRAVAGRIIGFVAFTERRRLLVVVGVPVVFTVLLDVVANYGVLVPFLGAGLAADLYTRPTAQTTIAASVYGVRVLLLGLFLLELYWNVAQGSTEPLRATATRLLWRVVTGTVLVGLGLGFRRIDL
jgi:hypothetical protein